jgi:hypothetical protein
VPLLSSAFAVLGLDGGRSDLLGDIAPALTETGSTIISTGNAYGEVYRRALGDDVSVIALASALARPVGWASGTAVTGSPPAAVPRHNGARRTVRAAHAVRVHRVARRHRKRARRARHG